MGPVSTIYVIPVRMQWGNTEIICETKAEVKRAIKDLEDDPEVVFIYRTEEEVVPDD